MPKDSQTHNQEEWAEQVLKALQLEPAREAIEVDAASSPNPREIYEAEKSKLEKRLETLIKTSQIMTDKCDALVHKEAKAAFWKEAERAFALLQSAQTTMSGASRADRLDLDAISARLDAVQSHFATMESICKSNHADADRLINEVLSGQVAAFRQTVSNVQAQRDQLENWGLNLTGLEQRLADATKLLTQMTAAVSAHRILTLEDLVRQAAEDRKALEKSLSEAKRRQERLKQDTLHELSKIMSEAEALKADGAELDQPSQQHDTFLAALEQVKNAHVLAQTKLQEDRYQSALAQYNHMTAEVFLMKQQVLVDKTQKKHKRTILPKQSQTAKLMAQAQELRTKLNQAASMTGLIHRSSPLLAQYTQTCQSASGLLAEVLSDLITHNKPAAIDKLKTAAEHLEQLKEWHAGALDNIRAAQEQLDQLKAQITLWLTAPSEATQEQNLAHEAQVRQLDAHVKRANAYLQQSNANLARKAIAQAFKCFTDLIDLAEEVKVTEKQS